MILKVCEITVNFLNMLYSAHFRILMLIANQYISTQSAYTVIDFSGWS